MTVVTSVAESDGVFFNSVWHGKISRKPRGNVTFQLRLVRLVTQLNAAIFLA
jgi:hypothetical protein